MSAGNFTLYLANLDDMSLQSLAGATLKLALVGSSYTPNAATNGHSLYSDLSDELSTGGGYTSGGATLSGVTVTAVADGWKLTSDDVEWEATSGGIGAWRYGVLYVSGSLWGKTNPLVGYFLGDSTPADVPATSEGNTLTIQCPAAGWLDVTA